MITFLVIVNLVWIFWVGLAQPDQDQGLRPWWPAIIPTILNAILIYNLIN